MPKITICHNKKRNQIFVHSIPAKGHTLRLLLKGALKPILLTVWEVLYEIDADDQVKTVQIKAGRRGELSPPTGSLASRTWKELDWPSGTHLPGKGDSISLASRDSLPNSPLLVCNVVHDINQAERTQSIKIWCIDPSPLQVFSDEDIEHAFREDIEPLDSRGNLQPD